MYTFKVVYPSGTYGGYVVNPHNVYYSSGKTNELNVNKAYFGSYGNLYIPIYKVHNNTKHF